MKNLMRILGLIGLITLFLASCAKEELPVTQEGDVVITTKGMSSDIDPVPYGPDLLVTFINSDLPPIPNPSLACPGATQQPVFGAQYTITAVVTNVGNAPVTDYYEIIIGKATGTPFAYTQLSPTQTLAPGASHTYTLGPAPFLSGPLVPMTSQEVFVFADSGNTIAETNEANNRSKPYVYCGE